MARRKAHRVGGHSARRSKKVLSGKDLIRWKYQRYMQDYLAASRASTTVSASSRLPRLGRLAENTVSSTRRTRLVSRDLGLYDKRFMYEPACARPSLPVAGHQGPAARPRPSSPTSTWRPPSWILPACPFPIHARAFLVPLLHGQSPADWRTSVYYRYYHDPGHHNTAAHFGVAPHAPSSSITGRRMPTNCST